MTSLIALLINAIKNTQASGIEATIFGLVFPSILNAIAES